MTHGATTAAPPAGTAGAPLAQRADAPATLHVPPHDLGLLWRPLGRGDADALFELLATVEEAESAPYRTDRDEVVEKFEGDWKDLSRDSLGGFGPTGRLVAYGMVELRPGAATTVRVVLEGGVHPVVRGRGIGRALLGWQVGRARQKLATSGTSLPGRIGVYAEDGAHATRRLLERSGLAPRRYYRAMRRSLAQPVPVVDVGPDLRLVRWSADLDEAVRLAHNDAFRDHWGSEPATPESWAAGRAKFAPTWSFLVLDDAAGQVAGQPVVAGYALSGRYEQDWPVLGYTAGYTETLGVRRAYRGRRLAPALLAASMAAFRADGMDYAELDVDTANPSGAHGLYERLGYEVTHGSALYSIEL